MAYVSVVIEVERIWRNSFSVGSLGRGYESSSSKWPNRVWIVHILVMEADHIWHHAIVCMDNYHTSVFCIFIPGRAKHWVTELKLSLCMPWTKAQRQRMDTASLILNVGIRWEWSTTCSSHFNSAEGTPGTHLVQGWGGPSWCGCFQEQIHF